MCLAIAAQIRSIDKNYAIVHVMGIEYEVNIQLIDNPNEGDYVLVHAGCGIQKIDQNDYNFLQEIYKQMF